MTMNKYFLLGEASALLNVKPHVLSYAITSKQLPEPEFNLGNKRVFTEGDLQRAREYFQTRIRKEDIDMTDQPEFVSMRELGRYFGVSSHEVGRWLKELGLRNDDQKGKPTYEAFNQKLVKDLPSRNPGTFFWGWHRTKTLDLLQKAGHGLA